MRPFVFTVPEHFDNTVTLTEAQLGRDVYRKLRDYPAGKLWRPVHQGASDEAPVLVVEKKDSLDVISLRVQSSYFVGVVWVVPGVFALQVEPKLNTELRTIDILAILREALRDPENLDHLRGLLDVDFEVPDVPLPNALDGLRLFLFTEFLAVMGRIVRKGLRRGFHEKKEVFQRKFKGRVLLSETLVKRRSPRLSDQLTCRYPCFDADIPENRTLKAALRIVFGELQRVDRRFDVDVTPLIESARLALRTFEPVADTPVTAFDADCVARHASGNPLFRDYVTALALSSQILKLGTRGFERTSAEGIALQSNVPPHTINMAKLFELYAFRKLRRALPKSAGNWVEHHGRYHYQELDFLCKSVETTGRLRGFFVADAKYKPRYACQSVLKEDARQLSGYARLEKVIERLVDWGLPDPKRIVPCLIIYSDQNAPEAELRLEAVERVSGWADFFKIGLRLPERSE